MGGAGRSGDGLRMVSRLVWEGLGGLGMGCEWLAGLVSRVCVYVLEGLGGLGLGCEWLAGLVWEGLGYIGFIYKIVEITAASSNNGGGRVLGLLCMGRNRAAGSNVAVHFNFFLFFPCRIFLSVYRSHLR